MPILENYSERKSLIITIRQYINTFPEKLNSIIGDTEKKQEKFIKNLFFLQVEQLNLIKEMITFEITLKFNGNLINDTTKNALKMTEPIFKKFGFDVDGVSDSIFDDEGFKTNFKLMCCEIDISKYLSPKRAVFFHMVKNYFLKYNLNKNKNKMQNIENELKNIKIDEETSKK